MAFSRSMIFFALTALIGVSVMAASRPSGSMAKNSISRPALAHALAHLPAGNAGSFRVVTYNVAGLPDLLSRSHPSVNIPHMGPLLSDFDIALVQEDFAYSRQLRHVVSLPFKSNSLTGGILGMGDGLNRFSRFPFVDLQHEHWYACNGYVTDRNDCLAPKGFSAAIHYIGQNTMLEVYNLHMDAGISPADRRARLSQVRQLLVALREYSSGRAVIVAGDTNLWSADKSTFRTLLKAAGLRDACEVVGCPDRRRAIDKVLYRSGSDLELVPVNWRVDHRFVDKDGKSLSDHQPVAVKFRWKSLKPGMKTLNKADLKIHYRGNPAAT